MKASACLSFLLLFLSTRLAAPAAESLVNGDLEQFVEGVPVGWNVIDPTVYAVSTTQVSPFTDVYPQSGQSLFSPAYTVGFAELTQNFTPFTSPYRFSFDFMLDGTVTGHPWLVTVGGTSNPDFYLGITDGLFRVSDGESFGALHHDVTSLAPGTWYHVNVQVDPGAFTYSGSILPYGGAASTWTGLEMHRYDGDTRNLFVLSPAEIVSPLYLDNFSIVPVPEPSTLALLGLGGTVLWLAVRRRARG